VIERQTHRCYSFNTAWIGRKPHRQHIFDCANPIGFGDFTYQFGCEEIFNAFVLKVSRPVTLEYVQLEIGGLQQEKINVYVWDLVSDMIGRGVKQLIEVG
jgi:hypothetical protein